MNRRLHVKLVPFSLAFSAFLLWPLGVVLSGPVESNAPAASSSENERSTYDQRQTGKYNIHVSIKDVAIIEVDQNGIEDISYPDEDYYYDEAHLTMKPLLLNPSTTVKQPTANASTTTTNPSTTATINQTYSSNLLADIAALHSASNDSISTTQSSSLDNPKNDSHNKVTLDIQRPVVSSTIHPEESNSRSKDMSIIAPTREILIQEERRISPSVARTQENNSRIFKLKARRSHKQIPGTMRSGSAAVAYPFPHFLATKRCRAHQYRDAGGHCRSRRSSSILKKLLGTLVTLPFPNQPSSDEDQDDE